MPDNKLARRARRGVRSFQPSAAGKGDASRVDDLDAYRRNFDAIAWSRTKKELEKSQPEDDIDL